MKSILQSEPTIQGSVLTAHIESESRVSSAASSYVDTLPEPTIYLPVPADIGQQIESARDSLRDVILRHEGEMSKVEEIIQRKVDASFCSYKTTSVLMNNLLYLKFFNITTMSFLSLYSIVILGTQF